MKTRPNVSWVIAFIVVASVVILPYGAHAQCYLSQGCAPQDDLTYIPNGTGQVYHGDGASNNGVGGWAITNSDVNQCLTCHDGTDTLPYLMTGHKNTLRKFAPGVLWGGPDGSYYPTTDSHYQSGSTYNWTTGQVTPGWCTPLGTIAQNGLSPTDPSCQYPFYTLPNAGAPAAYTPIAPTVAAGGIRNLFYLYGGWQNYGGSSNPVATYLNTIFDSGLTGDSYPQGNFDCARCHATGYNFDNGAPEPTSNTNKEMAFITDSQLRRIPTDGYVAPGTTGTSSWYLTGVQCERCHIAAYGWGSHPWDEVTVTIPQYEAATALCMECHREENITMANPASNPPVVGNISPASPMQARDHGYCSDLSGSSYSVCVSIAANSWVYKPFIDHEAGQAFLNSPHARFSGNLTQNSQNASDLSISISGTYNSYFSESQTDNTKNYGCVGCHDPHQSTVPAANGNPITTTCNQCHQLAQTILSTTIHPSGPGTPFPSGTSADFPGACITCHMQAALGPPASHLFRISSDPNYWTFPSSAQLYSQGVTALGMETDSTAYNGVPFASATWLDVDLACGQCHVGNDGVTNEYGLTLPPGMPGAHAYTRAQLAQWAEVMHSGDPGAPTPTFSPKAGTYNSPQSVSILDSLSGATIYFTLDGSVPTTSSAVYSTPIQISSSTTISAMAIYPGVPHSNTVVGTFSIVLPTAPPPLFSPPPSTFSTSQSVTLSNTLGLPMYYTTDGSTPTTNSTPYVAAISVTKNTTINAITAAYGYITSAISSGIFLIQAPTPTFAPGSGTYSTSQNVVISDSVSGATIFYTNNGSIPTTSSTSCANPCTVAVSSTTTLKAIASGGGYTSSNVGLATYTFAAATPTFSPASGTYYSTPVNVTITDATPGVTIYYSTTGFPSTSSPSCTSPCNIALSTSTTIRAMAVGNGISQSGTAVATYTIAANTPTFSPPSGTYSSAQNVTISDTTGGVTIYYTTNGSIPTTSSTPCANPCSLTVSTTTTVKAIAAANGISQSSVAVATYTIP